MRGRLALVLFAALLACKGMGKSKEAPSAAAPPPPAPVATASAAPAATADDRPPDSRNDCAQLGAYYTLNGGLAKGGVNISCDGKCKDIKEEDGGAKVKLDCHLACSAIGGKASKFAGGMALSLDLARSDKDENRYSGTISDGKSTPDPITLTFKNKYDDANGQMTEKGMRWSLPLRPCKK